ncbi:hypothetical protein GEMRC1_007030 [Eukaryota sp. GEM-RC1]
MQSAYCLGASLSCSKHIFPIYPDKVLFLSDADVVLSDSSFTHQSITSLNLAPNSDISLSSLIELSQSNYLLALYCRKSSYIHITTIKSTPTEQKVSVESSFQCPFLLSFCFSPLGTHLFTILDDGSLQIYDWRTGSALQSFPLSLPTATHCIASPPPLEENLEQASILTVSLPKGVHVFCIQQMDDSKFKLRKVRSLLDNFSTVSLSLFHTSTPDVAVSHTDGISIINPFYGYSLLAIPGPSHTLLSSFVLPHSDTSSFCSLVKITPETSDPQLLLYHISLSESTVTAIIIRRVCLVLDSALSHPCTFEDDVYTDFIPLNDSLVSFKSSRPIIHDAIIIDYGSLINIEELITDHVLCHHSPSIVFSTPFSESMKVGSLVKLSCQVGSDKTLIAKTQTPLPFSIRSQLNSFKPLDDEKSFGFLATAPATPLNVTARYMFLQVFNHRPDFWTVPLTSNDSSRAHPTLTTSLFHNMDITTHSTLTDVTNSTPSSISFHPSGLFAAVSVESGSKTALVPLTIMASASSYRVLPIYSGQLKFSNGGSILACSSPRFLGQNSKVSRFNSSLMLLKLKDFYCSSYLSIYCSVDAQDVGALQSVSNGSSKVIEIVWASDDSVVIALFDDGVIVQWKLNNLNNLTDGSALTQSSFVCLNENKECKPVSLQLTKLPSSLRALSSSLTVKINDDFLLLALDFNKLFVFTSTTMTLISCIPLPTNATCMTTSFLLNGDTRVVIGLASGSIVSFTLGEVLERELAKAKKSYDECLVISKAHARPLLSLVDVGGEECDYLITMSNVGFGKVYSFSNFLNNSKYSTLPSHFLIDSSLLSSTLSTPGSLTRNLGELHTQQDFKLRQVSVDFVNKLSEVTKSLAIQITRKKEEYSDLLQDISDLRASYASEIEHLDLSQAKEIDETRSSYSVMRDQRSNFIQSLEDQKRSLIDRSENEIRDLINDHELELKQHQEENSNHLQDLSLRLEKLSEELQSNVTTFQERINQCRDDGDAELASLKARLADELSAERERLTRLKAERAMLSKKIGQVKRGIEDRLVDIKSLSRHDETLLNTIQTLEQERKALVGRMKERDRVIGDKEARIFDLKIDNQDLDKWKFVLDHQIGELRGQIDPKLKEIKTLTVVVDQLFEELQNAHNRNHKMALQIREANDQLSAVQSNAKSAYVLVLDLERLFGRILTTVTKASQLTHDEGGFEQFCNN